MDIDIEITHDEPNGLYHISLSNESFTVSTILYFSEFEALFEGMWKAMFEECDPEDEDFRRNYWKQKLGL